MVDRRSRGSRVLGASDAGPETRNVLCRQSGRKRTPDGTRSWGLSFPASRSSESGVGEAFVVNPWLTGVLPSRGDSGRGRSGRTVTYKVPFTVCLDRRNVGPEGAGPLSVNLGLETDFHLSLNFRDSSIGDGSVL